LNCYPAEPVLCWDEVVAVVDTPGADSWGKDDNARRYDTFAHRFPMYARSSRELIALARPPSDSTVLDLACGTGITTEAILAVLGPAGRVIGADKSAAMLAVAAEAIADPRVVWIQTPAEDVDQHVTELVDAVVCNSAIWQTDIAATAAAVRNVVATGSRFVFNIGAGFFDDSDDPNFHDDQGSPTSVMMAIAAQDYGWTMPVNQPRRAPLSRASVYGSLGAAGFEVEQVEEFVYEESAASVRAWLSVPIFTEQYLPGLAYEHRMRVLGKALDQLGDSDAPEESRWVAFVATASGQRG
jgi:SAM-dependent methyltransferase